MPKREVQNRRGQLSKLIRRPSCAPVRRCAITLIGGGTPRPWGDFKAIDIFTAKSDVKLLSMAIGLIYFVIPVIMYLFYMEKFIYLQLAFLTIITLIGILLGFRIRIFDKIINSDENKLIIDANIYVRVMGFVFIVFFAITMLTANTIPIISAIKGGLESDALSQERGEFLKGREGAWIVLLYLSAILTSSIMPYCIIVAYSIRSRFRHYLSALFLFFSISFLVKALFLNLIIVFVAYGIESRKINTKHLLRVMVASMLILLAMIYLSGYGNAEQGDIFSFDTFFSPSYKASSPLHFLIYRIVAVPVYTAVDTLVVHSTQFDGRMFLGATSSVLSTLTGQDRINLERYVFEYEYGGWNDYANANTVFFIDGFVNFWWFGVFVFGIIVGLLLRIFNRSKDPAFRSLAPLFIFLLVSSSLIGMLFSNGYLLMFFQIFLIKLNFRRKQIIKKIDHGNPIYLLLQRRINYL